MNGDVNMTQHSVEIIIDENGQIEGEIKGIKGGGCEAVFKWLSRLGNVLSHKSTKEKFQKEALKEKVYVRH